MNLNNYNDFEFILQHFEINKADLKQIKGEYEVYGVASLMNRIRRTKTKTKIKEKDKINYPLAPP